MNRITKAMVASALLGAAVATPASAQLVLNQAIVDLTPDKPRRMDIEASNTSTERLYIAAEPFEIIDPGKATERRVANPDPASLGLLVTPQKMVLEPGEHKLVRIASIAPPGGAERIYRVTIKPIAGDISAASSALKILVGYDVLVIVRPMVSTGTVIASRQGDSLKLTNTGTTNVEIYDGKQCGAKTTVCTSLPSRRLYAGASIGIKIDPTQPVDYRIKTGVAVVLRQF